MPERVAEPSSTEHTIRITDAEFSYTARVARIEVTDEAGERLGDAYTFAYLAHTDQHFRDRPVVFLFNGGPGSSSQWLHLGGLGPRRVAIPTDLARGALPPYCVEDSPATLLGAADLVFVDPLGTGLSIAASAEAQSRVYSVIGDARQFAKIVSGWLQQEHRFGSPVYILGESYGTVRAPFLARELLHGANPAALSGIILLGQAVNLQETAQRPGNITANVAALPFMAAVAWYHGVGGSEYSSAEQATSAALHYAFGDYATLLFQGSTAPPDQLAQAAARLEALTGITAQTWLQKRLRLSKDEYRRLVLRDRNQVTGSNDARYAALAEDDKIGEYFVDPASSRVSPAFAASMDSYLYRELGVDTSARYRGIDTKAYAEWQWSDGGTPGRHETGNASPFDAFRYVSTLTAYLKEVIDCRLFVGTGYYDSLTTIGAAHHLITQYGLPQDRVTKGWYEAGHMMYTDPRSAVDLRRDLQAFVTTPRSAVDPTTY